MPAAATERGAPVPFVIGVPRSGTTLVRLMLNAHPELAIPPETGFIPAVRNGGDSPAAFLHRLTGFETWPDLGLEAGGLERELRGLEPFTLSDAVRTVYRLYAARFGKPRFGDKTPMYVRHIPEVRATLPEVRFVHIIRDGRDVALSVRRTWFSPGDTIAAIALDWRERIDTARCDAGDPSTYMEVRYEDLLHDPTATLRAVCDFLDLTLDHAMERFWEHGEIGEEELRARTAGPDRRTVASEARLAHHRRTARPVAPERAGRWRGELTAAERGEFEAVAGNLLRDLGYETGG